MKRKKKNMKKTKVAVKTRKSRQGRGSSIKSGKFLFKKSKTKKPVIKVRNIASKKKKPIKVTVKKNTKLHKVKTKPKAKLIKKLKSVKPIKRSVKKQVIKKIVLKKKLKKVNPIKYRKKITPAKKKTRVQEQKTDFIKEPFFKAKIKVIGIGGGGSSIVSEIGRSLNKATFVVADTDMRAFKKKAGIKYFLFGQKLTHGLGTGVNPDLGRMAAEQEKERIAHFFDDQDIVIFIASLGGGLGSGATQVFAEAAKNFNGITFGIFTLPFKFEGKNKYKIAVKALRELRKSLNVSITIPNERIFKIIEPNTAITDAFSIVNKNLIESLESIIDLIYSPGIINIDFADLRAILRGKGNLAFLNTAEASGKDRALDIAKKILHNPLYQNNNFTAEKILFNISGGGNLSMFEVDKISRSISDLNPKAKIIFGVSKNSKYKNKIKTTLLMTGGGTGGEAVIPTVKTSPKKDLVEDKAKNILKVKVTQKDKPLHTEKKTKGIIKKPKKDKVDIVKKEDTKEKIPFIDTFAPVFNDMSFVNQSVEPDVKKLTVFEAPVNRKKAIRRSALDIKKAEELRESKQSLQEKEWEIPAFLRKAKLK